MVMVCWHHVELTTIGGWWKINTACIYRRYPLLHRGQCILNEASIAHRPQDEVVIPMSERVDFTMFPVEDSYTGPRMKGASTGHTHCVTVGDGNLRGKRREIEGET